VPVSLRTTRTWIISPLMEIEGPRCVRRIWHFVKFSNDGSPRSLTSPSLFVLINFSLCYLYYLYSLYISPNVIRVIRTRSKRWVRNVELLGEKRNVYRVLLGTREGKRLLGRTSRGYDIFINCTRWQYTFTHKQYIEQHK
jgi:hypothetical protein